MFKLKKWTKKSDSSQSTEKWEKLERKLDEGMFGQHIAVGEVLHFLKGHFSKPNPTKALVIICNGSLGTGKTYFANMIVNNIYDTKQKRVKMFVGPRDYPDSSETTHYQEDLRQKIESQVKGNPRSFFIFDEVDKMPVGLLDALSPYVDRYEKIGGIDFRKCVFLFLSNTGGRKIDKIVLNQFINEQPREHLSLFHFRNDLEEAVLNEKGGLYNSAIIRQKLIDQYVPFLPLERRHLVSCLQVEYELISNTFDGPVDLSEVAEMFDYYPKEFSIFSEEGAKNVYIKLLQAREFINKNLPLPKKRKQSDTEENSIATGIEEFI